MSSGRGSPAISINKPNSALEVRLPTSLYLDGINLAGNGKSVHVTYFIGFFVGDDG